MAWSEQLETYKNWLIMSKGNLSVIEDAIMNATQEFNRAPTKSEIEKNILEHMRNNTK